MAASAPAPFFYVQPAAGTDGHPAVVVIMEGGGMSQQLLRVCQRLAHEGYTAIAPDLFHQVMQAFKLCFGQEVSLYKYPEAAAIDVIADIEHVYFDHSFFTVNGR